MSSYSFRLPYRFHSFFSFVKSSFIALELTIIHFNFYRYTHSDINSISTELNEMKYLGKMNNKRACEKKNCTEQQRSNELCNINQ